MPNDSTVEFTYDANGNMTKDLDRNIVTIQYNLLNLPDEIWFSDGSLTINQYDASGQKLWTRDFTLQTALIEPLILYSEAGLNAFFENYSYNVNDVYEYRTDYVDNMEFKSCASQTVSTSDLSRVNNAEGYVNFSWGSSVPRFHYFRRDHLGNVREVWRASYTTSSGTYVAASTVQRTQYYPSGLPWASNSGDNPSTQTKKYNGKEFLEMHGLDEYDSQARMYYPAIVRTTTLDPLAEKYYSISPYAWCGGNPVKYVDPDGRQVAIPYKLYRGYKAYRAYKAYQVTKIAGAATGAWYLGGYLSSEDVQRNANSIIDGLNTTGERTLEAKGASHAQKKEQERRETNSRLEDVEKVKSHNQNMKNNNADGSGDPKRNPSEVWGIIKTIVGGTSIGSGLGVQLTNPDPSKDANESHLEKANSEDDDSQKKEENKNSQK